MTSSRFASCAASTGWPLMIRFGIARSLSHRYRVPVAHFATDAAADALVGVNHVDLALLARDRVFGAFAPAERTAVAVFGDDVERDECLAHARRAALFLDVGFVFVAEITDRAEDRIGGRFAQAAERTVFDGLTHLFQQLDVTLPTFAVYDVGQDRMHLEHALATGHALAARFELGEIQEIAGHVHHAGVFVHHDHAARPHHGASRVQAFIVQRQVQQAFGETTAGRAA